MSVGTFPINQEQNPDDLVDEGARWKDLGPGVFNVTTGTLMVQLSNLSDEFVMADAVRIERIA